MSTPTKKWRAALNMDQQKEYAKANPKSIQKTDKYGTTQWVDITEWEDGNLTISGYDAETKQRFNIGIARAQEAQQTAKQASVSAQTVTTDDDLPF